MIALISAFFEFIWDADRLWLWGVMTAVGLLTGAVYFEVYLRDNPAVEEQHRDEVSRWLVSIIGGLLGVMWPAVITIGLLILATVLVVGLTHRVARGISRFHPVIRRRQIEKDYQAVVRMIKGER